MLSILDSLTVSFEANDLFISYGSPKCEKLAMLPKHGYMITEISIVIHNGIYK